MAVGNAGRSAGTRLTLRLGFVSARMAVPGAANARIDSTCIHVRSFCTHSAPDPGDPTSTGPMGAESDDVRRPIRLSRCTAPPVAVLPRGPPPEPVAPRRCDVSIRICDRCGDVTLHGEGCTCSTPYSPSEVRRRHRAAVESARISSGGSRDRTSPQSPTDDRVETHRTAAAAVSGERAQARVPGPDSISRPSSGGPPPHADAAPPVPHEPRQAPDPGWLPAIEPAPPAPTDHHRQTGKTMKGGQRRRDQRQ
jgi:hypothetical protein